MFPFQPLPSSAALPSFWISHRRVILTALLLPLLNGLVSCRTLSPKPTALLPFASDGCTSFPEGTAKEPDAWGVHCERHDFSYWRGGTWKERRESDQRLRHDIQEAGYPMVAHIVYTGVRIGGSPLWPTPWRWGFGWDDYPRLYRPLTPAEEQKIKETLATHPPQ